MLKIVDLHQEEELSSLSMRKVVGGDSVSNISRMDDILGIPVIRPSIPPRLDALPPLTLEE
jgi:hypothetical protein